MDQEDITRWLVLLDKFKENKLKDEDERRWFFFVYNRLSSKVPVNSDQVPSNIENIIWNGIQNDMRKPKLGKPSSISLLRIIAVASMILCVFGLSLYWLNSKDNWISPINEQEIVMPGQEGGTIKIGNNPPISLSDKRLQKGLIFGNMKVSTDQYGILVYESLSGEGEVNQFESTELKTDLGQTMKVRLPDASTVWLNAGSSLVYKNDIGKRSVREVFLEGEAYFDIAKNLKQPFIVQTSAQVVEVKGTKFNIHAYNEHPVTTTTVTEGVVEVKSRHGLNKDVLKVGEQTIVGGGKWTKLRGVDTELYTSWVSNYFKFDGNIRQILDAIGRWYNVEIEINKLPKHKNFYGKISRTKTLNEVLEVINISSDLKLEVKNQKVILKD